MTTPVMQSTPTKKYPANDITPHGWYSLTKGHPTLRLRAWDGSIDFYLRGGYSIPDYYTAPECVLIPKDGLSGLIPPWKHIDQKGATQDGTTQLDALYDPMEVRMNVVCRGRDGRHTQQVASDLIASIDAKYTSPLEWMTPDLGFWWAPLRWFQGAPTDPLAGPQTRSQKLSLRLRADDGFWRTNPDTVVKTGSTGFVARTNIGDQPRYDDYVLFGPGIFRIGNGPSNTEYVEFGPLVAGQIAYLRTDPRRRLVYDLSTVPANVPAAQQTVFSQAISDFASFANAANTNALMGVIQSIFGLFGTGPAPVPPQGNFYSLLKGRFSNAAAIPPKSPGNPAQTYNIRAEISGGGSGSKIIASGISKRRWPL